MTRRELNRAVLARQLLLEREQLSVPRALDRVAGIQSQYAPTMYVGLWSRLDDFRRDTLTRALTRRTVVQGTLLRSTIHLVSQADYWPLARAIRDQMRIRSLRAGPGQATESEMRAAADRVRAASATAGQLTLKDLQRIAGPGAARGVGAWIDMVRVPPSGTWERRRADHYAAAEDWIGPEPDIALDDALDHLVRRYLTGFGPATVNEIANWAMLLVGQIKPALDRLDLRRFRSEDGKELVDLPLLLRPPADTPAPVRFLSTWEAVLLVHARRAMVLRRRTGPASSPPGRHSRSTRSSSMARLPVPGATSAGGYRSTRGGLCPVGPARRRSTKRTAWPSGTHRAAPRVRRTAPARAQRGTRETSCDGHGRSPHHGDGGGV